MKKNLLWLTLILLTSFIAIAAYKPIKAAMMKDNRVDKTISFAIYKGSNYASKVYNSTSAEICITVEKVTNTNRTVVWDTTIDAKLLSKYPSVKKAFSQKVTVRNVIENKEHLEMSYVLTYNSNGSVLKMLSREFVLDGLKTFAISI
ncbi:MAG: hypothetical protein ABJA79_07280 [Parafilimonas sp.]